MTDEQGKDITNVKVYSADQTLVETLDGRPVRLDPGKHRFRFVLPWGEVLASDALIREGEKNRLIAVQVKSSAADQAKLPPGVRSERSGSVPLPPPEPATKRPVPPGFWIASGVGIAALGSWGVFALLGRAQQNDVEACSPNCDSSHRGAYDAMRRDYLIADVSLGVAAISVGVAIWLFFSRPSPTPAEHKVTQVRPWRFAVVPWVTTTGASIGLAAAAF